MQCRVCMQSKCHILFDMNILGTQEGRNLYDCFNECTQLDASANDGLPKTLCKICAQKLQIAYNFRRSAKQSDEEFKNLLLSQKIKTDSELSALEDMETRTDDPLDMSFQEALTALKEPLVKFPKQQACLETSQKRSPKENIYLEKSSKSANPSFEEVLREPLVKFPKERICLEEPANTTNGSLKEALTEPLVEFPKETICLETKTPNGILEETLVEPLVEFPKSNLCLEKLSKSPNPSFEEALREPLVRFSKETICLEKPAKTPNGSLEETLAEPLVEFPNDNLSLEELSKSPDRSLEETQIEIVSESISHWITETPDNSLQENDEITNEFETFDSFSQDESESEMEPIEKVGYACEICKSTYTIKNELKKHISEQHKSEVICVSCSKVYDMPNELRIHKKLVHGNDSPVQCDFCSDNPLMPRNELLKHFQTVHPSRYFRFFPRLRKRRAIDSEDPTAYECKYCKSTFPTGFDLEEHIRSHIFRCPICFKHFNRFRTYYTHAKRLHNCTGSILPSTALVVNGAEEKPIECKACNKSYAKLGSYNTHMKQKHGIEAESNSIGKTTENEIMAIQTYKAAIAKKESEYSPSLEDIEVEWQATAKKNKSDEINLSGMQNNVVDQVPKKAIKTKSVKKQPSKNTSTTITRATNTTQFKEKKGYLCSFCPRVLCSNVSLRTHEKTQHLDAKKDLIKECPICQKKLNMDYINKHIRIVHIGERNNVCDICGGTYKCISQLRRHKLLHMTDRQWQCSVCNRKFSEKSALQVHMRIHTGEMPYACHICERRFRIKVHLTYHLERHANIKKICNVCGKSFSNGTSLRKHSFEHTGNMPYKCNDCGYETVKREYIITHMLRKHGRKMTEDELFLMFKTNTGKSPRVKDAEYFKKLTAKLQKSDNSN